VARARPRRLLGELACRLARLLLGVFFRDVEVVGRERVPRGAPLLIIANHVNNLIDPMLILGYAGVRPRFLAKSTLWKHPIVAPAVILLGALPVYRRRDGVPMARNFETFARCRLALAAGETIAIFPEGYSHNEPGAVPLKTGPRASRWRRERMGRPACAWCRSASSTRTRNASAPACWSRSASPSTPRRSRRGTSAPPAPPYRRSPRASPPARSR